MICVLVVPSSQLCTGCCPPHLWCAAGLGMLRTAPTVVVPLTVECTEAVPGVSVPRHRSRDGQVAGALLLWVWAVRAEGLLGAHGPVLGASSCCDSLPACPCSQCSPTVLLPAHCYGHGCAQLCATSPSSCAPLPAVASSSSSSHELCPA